VAWRNGKTTYLLVAEPHVYVVLFFVLGQKMWTELDVYSTVYGTMEKNTMKSFLWIAIVLVGALLLVSYVSRARVGALRTESQSVELGGNAPVRVEIDFGAGELELAGGAQKLLEADFAYNVAELKPEVEYTDGTLVVRQPDYNSMLGLREIDDFRNEWSLRLYDGVPMDLNVDVGAGTSDLQLAGLSLTRLNVTLGAGKSTVDLGGDWMRNLDVTIDAGAADISVQLPRNVGARVEVESGVGPTEAAGLTRDGNVYTNAAYGVSEVTLQITLKIGIGRVNLEVEEAAQAEGEAARTGFSVPVKYVLTAPLQQQGLTDRAEVETFLDELFGRQMEEHHIAGAVVAVVKDGELFFAKGYGYADLEEGIPIDPEQTLFRIGSVTKLFTWTAVMQLVEQGKLDLEADINSYLDFRIPDSYPQPVTLEHLLTHTAGFEDRFFEVLASDTDDMMPEREWLISHMPARVRPPGDCAAYSNYGTSLAGYIVARVSGQPYEQYIQEHILNPLGMVRTTALSPEPPEMRAHASLGYTYVDGDLQAFPDYLGQPAIVPGAGISASATDMARFMIAHLQHGRYSDEMIAGARILKETTAQQMHSTLFTHDPRLLGTAYGFFEFSDNGQRTIGHSGETFPINSLLLLMPDQKVGIFVSYNSEGGAELTNQHLGFQRAFFDHYYPAPALDPLQAPADFAERAGRFVGSYKLTRSSYTTIEKVANLTGALKISNPGDGTLLFTTPWGEWPFVEVEPLYFRQVDGQFGIVFREDNRGRITHMFTDLTPMFAFEKLKWYDRFAFNMALALGCALLFLSMTLVAAIRLVRNRRLSDDPQPASGSARVAYWIILGISILNLLFLAGTVLWGDPMPLFGVSMLYRIVLGLAVLAAVLTAGALVYAVLAWKNRYWSVAARGYYTLVTVAALAFVWFLNSWNLLGWRF
jgi:CubicO group peptidase (beta-lactamase class C family)